MSRLYNIYLYVLIFHDYLRYDKIRFYALWIYHNATNTKRSINIYLNFFKYLNNIYS